MIRLEVFNRTFQIEFRHLRRGVPFGANAITTCVIAAPGLFEEVFKFLAIGSACCSHLDQFSRRIGRLRAFENAVEHCAVLRRSRARLLAAYDAMDPPTPATARSPRFLSEAEKRARWEAGWEKRLARQSRRAVALKGAL